MHGNPMPSAKPPATFRNFDLRLRISGDGMDLRFQELRLSRRPAEAEVLFAGQPGPDLLPQKVSWCCNHPSKPAGSLPHGQEFPLQARHLEVASCWATCELPYTSATFRSVRF